MVLPSDKYPADRYGPPFNYDGNTATHENDEDPQLGGGLHSSGTGLFARSAYPIGLAYQASHPITDDNGTVTGQTPERVGYGLDNKIWSVFDITPPAPLPPAPVNTCNVGDRACQADFATQQAAYDALKTPYVAQYEALNDAITAFNADFGSRLVREWNVYSVTSTTTTQDSVTASAPGKILAGGNLSIAGALNNDKSRIVAGGDFNGSGAQTINADALGVSRIDAHGTVTYTYGEDCTHGANESQPFDAPLADEVIYLSICGSCPATRLLRSAPCPSRRARHKVRAARSASCRVRRARVTRAISVRSARSAARALADSWPLRSARSVRALRSQPRI